ncbi:MAG: alanine--tRNA ligase, partial [Flavobacterium sp.]
TGKKYNSAAANEAEEKINIAIRVIADHVRAVAFAIADGQLPSNGGAGYVIRRILRRAIRYGFTFLETREPFINELVAVLSAQMGDFFPEIKSQQNLVTNVIREEEASFLRRLDQGLQLLDNVIAQTDGKEVAGAKAFELYDTFGFPEDLTALILKEKGLDYNKAEFDAKLKEQKDRSRLANEMTTDDWVILTEGNTESFVGYDQLENTVSITRYRKIDSKKDGVQYQLVLSATPFYPEGGGQVGDRGTLKSINETIEILDTKKENNLILHIANTLPDNVNTSFTATVDADLRDESQSNHTATHLLHQALRSILGTHVEQKGSYVGPSRLRFDFSHFAKVTDEQLQEIESFVNARIQDHLPLIERRDIPFKQAVEEGAMALFGEKYGDSVRAIKFGESMELCGGTHVKNTADIWYFKIVSEGAVAAGIRRIEAITNDAVKAHFAQQEKALEDINGLLKNPQDTLKAVVSLQDENAKLKKQLELLLRDKAKNLKGELATELQEINGVQFLAKQVDLDPTGAKDLAYELGSLGTNLFLVLATADEGKPMLTCYISKELVAEKGLNAGAVVRELGKYIQGGGGGQPFFATAGGKKVEGINDALNAAVEFVTGK